MSENEDKSSKTEEPTEQKLRKARQKGDVPASRESGTMMVVFSLFIVTVFILPGAVPDLAGVLGRMIDQAPRAVVGDGRAGLHDLGELTGTLATGIFTVMGPALLVIVLCALFGVLIQGETVVSLERIKPKPSKLSPLQGLKKIVSPDSLVEFAKSVTKVLVVGAIAAWVAQGAVRGIWQSEAVVPQTLLLYASGAIAKLLIAVCAFLVPVAILDILWKRAQWVKKQRMSLREIRDEHKESEGDPHIRARRADLRRQRARQRIAAAVPTASVILTNPTHYAVALRYEPGQDTAPVCVAKGADVMAARIRELGRAHEVPIVENKPLARALYATMEVDDMVPGQHWQAVAEIIGYVMDLRRNIRRAPPAGSQLRDWE